MLCATESPPRCFLRNSDGGARDDARKFEARGADMERDLTAYLNSSAEVELRFGLIPERLRGMVGSEVEWLKFVRAHLISIQAPFHNVLAPLIPASYYAELFRSSQEKFQLYPYHLAAEFDKHPSSSSTAFPSPFEYYLEMIIELLKSERSYDTIPSFTAADCVRLVQCGRNEFIHALNACRSKGFFWKRRRALIAKTMPPQPPAELPVSHWWEVHPTRSAAKALKVYSLSAANPDGTGLARTASTMQQASSRNAAKMSASAKSLFASTFGGAAAGGQAAGGGSSTPPEGRSSPAPAPAAAADEEDEEAAAAAEPGGEKRQGLSAVEADALSKLVGNKSGQALLAGSLPREAVCALHAAGLVRFSVPVSPSDRLAVPPLTGFVMNRVGNDYLEKLLYEMFVSNDESTTLGNLAALLDQPAERVTRAASIACLLGFARKLTAPNLDNSSSEAWHSSWVEEGSAVDANPASSDDARDASPLTSAPASDDVSSSGVQRVALLVDSRMAACLMMSNLADELKQHAVTLYEVGKIPHEALDKFLSALVGVERPKIEEADVLAYFDQAIALRTAVVFLRSSKACELDGTLRPLDIVRTESLSTLDDATRDRVLLRSYALLISMAPMVPSIEHIYTASLPIHHFGPTYQLLTSPWLPLTLCEALGRGPISIVLPRGARLSRLPSALSRCTHLLLLPWGGEPITVGVGSLLSVASELLLRSPLLIQEYVSNATEGTASVALPVEGGDGDAPPVDVSDSNQEAAEEDDEDGVSIVRMPSLDLADPPATGSSPSAARAAPASGPSSAREEARAVQSALDLDCSTGVVQLVKLPVVADSSAGNEEKGSSHRDHRWLPLCVHFGMPLSDVPTCEASCQAIETRQLFTAESLAKHKAALVALLARVERCVEFARGEEDEEEDEEEVAADPMAPLLFDGERLRRLGDVAELY